MQKQRRRLASVLVATVVAVALLLIGGAAGNAAVAARPSGSALTAPVTGTFTDAAGGAGTFAGTVAVNRFVNQNGSLAAAGTLTGTLTDSAGTVLGTVTQQVTLPAVITQATCQILHLELGPLDLNLLGLVVHLNRIVLDITAVQGPGNLLGNLLCAIAGLLDNSSLSGLLAVLNQILALLR